MMSHMCNYRGSTSSIAVNGGAKSSCLSSNVVDLHSGKHTDCLLILKNYLRIIKKIPGGSYLRLSKII